MDVSTSPEETYVECCQVEPENPSTDLTETPAAPEGTDASELLAANQLHSVCAAAFTAEDTMSAAEADMVESYLAETVDKQAVSITSSPRSEAEESQSQVNSTLQELEVLRARVLRQIETANEMNEDDRSTMAEEHMIFQCLLNSLELGIGELQACVVSSSFSHFI